MRGAQPAPMGRPGGHAVSSQQAPGGVAGGRSEAGKTLHAKEDEVRPKKQTPAARTPPVATRLAGSDPATYWTPQRMRDAQPAPMGRPGEPTGSPSSPEPTPGGTAGGTSEGSGTVVDGP
jgi:hypothetical protein